MHTKLKIAVLALFVFSLAGWAADDARIGTWKVNLAKSKFGSGPAPKSTTAKLEPHGSNGVKATSERVDAQGQKTIIEYTADYDGKDYPVTGDPGRDTVAMKRIDAYTLEVTNKKAGKIANTGKEVLSKDGKVRTITTHGTDAQGRPFTNVSVYEKQ